MLMASTDHFGSLMTRTTLQQEYDIAIVGAGMVGATMALALADTGLRLALLDARPPAPVESLRPDEFDARVSAMTHASRRQFEQLGVWPLITGRRVCPYTHMHVREADGTGQIDFDARDVASDSLGHIVENSVVLAALQEALSLHVNVELLAPVKVTGYSIADEGDGLLAIDDQDGNPQTLQAGLIIAADGANSQLRGLAGLKTREWDYEHHAVVTTVRTALAHEHTARQIFMDEGVLAFLPLQDNGDDPGHYCSIVWSVVPEKAATLMGMPDDQFCQVLTLASESWLGPVISAAQRFSFPLRQRHAADYYQGPLVLIGDAAHSIHPLAGQGANLGLQDVQVLAQEIRRAVRTGRRLNDPLVLSRYQRQRKVQNLGMMAVMETFKRLYSDQPLPVRWLRNTGMRAVDGWPLLKNQIMRQALG